MKDYFLAFDFYNHEINKFYYGVVSIDLKTQTLTEVAEEIIRDRFYRISPHDVTIKITAFNNINI